MMVRMGRDQLMSEQRANHARVASAPSAGIAHRAAAVKVALLDAQGVGGEPLEPPT